MEILSLRLYEKQVLTVKKIVMSVIVYQVSLVNSKNFRFWIFRDLVILWQIVDRASLR
jgi:hypothetical protein